MQLIYLWIEKYKNIENQGFNFSPLHRFHFEPSKDPALKGGTLTDEISKEEHEKLSKVYEKFFGEHISNVTAIVGKNGSGKSSVLEFIETLSLPIRYSESDFIAIFDKEQLLEKKVSYIEIRYFKNIVDDRLSIKDKFKASYYSNMVKEFDLTFIDKELDISTTNLIQTSTVRDNSPHYIPYLETYNRSEIQKQIDFINFIDFIINRKNNSNTTKKTIPFKIGNIEISLPYYLRISIRKSKENKYLTELTTLQELRTSNRALELLEEYMEWFYNNELSTIANSLSDENKKNYTQARKRIEKEFLQFIKEEPNLVFEYGMLYIPIINIKPNSIAYSVLTLLQFFNSSLCYRDYNTFNLSSGEYQLLSLFSRLSYFNRSVHIGNSLALLIDEGELGMHPQWQKQYLSMLRDALPIIFPNKKIQLILTTHSPFLVSDLPKENIIFLDRDAQGKCIVADLSSKKATFGANIHTLFADSFFMENGLMGEFAAQKIKEILDFLNGKNDKLSEDYVSLMIDRIGEPIVREQLRRMFNNRQKIGFDQLEDRVKQLEKELEELKKQNKDQ